MCTGEDEIGNEVWQSLCGREIGYWVLDEDRVKLSVAAGCDIVEEGQVMAFAASTTNSYHSSRMRSSSVGTNRA